MEYLKEYESICENDIMPLGKQIARLEQTRSERDLVLVKRMYWKTLASLKKLVMDKIDGPLREEIRAEKKGKRKGKTYKESRQELQEIREIESDAENPNEF